MTEKYAIIERIARERRVETIIANVCRSDAPEMQDFAQMIYLALLEKDDELILRLDRRNSLDYYIAAMVSRQWNTDHSAFRDLFSKYQRKAGDTDVETQYVEDDDFWDKPRIARGGEDVRDDTP